jgi:hypothetical protein
MWSHAGKTPVAPRTAHALDPALHTTPRLRVELGDLAHTYLEVPSLRPPMRSSKPRVYLLVATFEPVDRVRNMSESVGQTSDDS